MRKQDVINHFRVTLQDKRRKAGLRGAVTENMAIVELAQAVGLTRNAIYKWPEELDFHRQCVIQVVTAGAFQADPCAPANAAVRRNRKRVRKAEEVRERLGL